MSEDSSDNIEAMSAYSEQLYRSRAEKLGPFFSRLAFPDNVVAASITLRYDDGTTAVAEVEVIRHEPKAAPTRRQRLARLILEAPRSLLYLTAFNFGSTVAFFMIHAFRK